MSNALVRSRHEQIEEGPTPDISWFLTQSKTTPGRRALIKDAAAGTGVNPAHEIALTEEAFPRAGVFVSSGVSNVAREMERALVQLAGYVRQITSAHLDRLLDSWIDLDMRLQPPRTEEKTIRVRFRFGGPEEPRVPFDPDID
jgi:hypothetical protein